MKRSYHTDIAIQFKLGVLNANLKREIPSSTLHNWKTRDFSSLVGNEYVTGFEQNLEMIKEFLAKKHLLNAAKAVYFIYRAYHTIVSSIKNHNAIIRRSVSIIVDTIDKVKDTISLKRALRAFDISYQQYYAWKKKIQCQIAPHNLCKKIYPNQLTAKEINTIKAYLSKPQYHHWSISTVYFQILRDKAAFFSKTTFYNYVNRLNLQRAKPIKQKYATGIRSDASKKLLHMDVTIYRPLDHSSVYLYFLVDNYSRYILNWKASLEYSAKITFQNISEAYDKYRLGKINPKIDLVCDGGSENKGMVDTFVNNPNNNIRKLIAQTDIRFSNSMVEAVNKRMKYDFLFTTKLINIEQVIKYLIWAVEQYNHKPHTALFGLTPTEVFNGALPDKNMYKPAMQHAAKMRKEVNLNQQCLNCTGNSPMTKE